MSPDVNGPKLFAAVRSTNVVPVMLVCPEDSVRQPVHGQEAIAIPADIDCRIRRWQSGLTNTSHSVVSQVKAGGGSRYPAARSLFTTQPPGRPCGGRTQPDSSRQDP